MSPNVAQLGLPWGMKTREGSGIVVPERYMKQSVQLLTAVPRPRTSQQFPMPKVQSRQAWEDTKKAERAIGARTPTSANKPIELNQALLSYALPCAHCSVCMGPAYVNRELYLAPSLTGRSITWEVVCETCATDDLELGSGFLIASERDYTQAAALGTTVSVDDISLKTKIVSLERFLLPAWKQHVAYLRGLAELGPGTHKPFDRTQQFDRFVRSLNPPTKTYADLNPNRVFSKEALALRAARAKKAKEMQDARAPSKKMLSFPAPAIPSGALRKVA